MVVPSAAPAFWDVGTGVGPTVPLVEVNSTVIVPISAGTPVALTVPPELEVAETAVTCWSDDADPPLPHPATAAAITVHTANMARCRRRSLPLTANTASVIKPSNSIDTPPAGPGETIEASFKLFNCRRPKLVVPLGGVLVRVPFRVKEGRTLSVGQLNRGKAGDIGAAG
jgi:hypothetical protein